jgi:hypothetical protein
MAASVSPWRACSIMSGLSEACASTNAIVKDMASGFFLNSGNVVYLAIGRLGISF